LKLKAKAWGSAKLDLWEAQYFCKKAQRNTKHRAKKEATRAIRVTSKALLREGFSEYAADSWEDTNEPYEDMYWYDDDTCELPCPVCDEYDCLCTDVTAPWEDTMLDEVYAKACDPQTPPEWLEEVAVSPHYGVEIKRAIASNPNTPIEALVRLAQLFPKEFMTNAFVQLYALETPGFWVELIRSKRELFVELLAQPYTPEELLSTYAKHPDGAFRKGVARNPVCPEALLASLAEDSEYYVRAAVANNASTPQHLLAVLAVDSHEWVRGSLWANPMLDSSAQLQLLREKYGRTK